MDDLKVPPHSLEAERAVLGSILIDPECRHGLEIKPEDFYSAENRAIFAAMMRVQTPDIVTTGEALGVDLELVGGIAAIADLANSVSTSQNVNEYAEIVKERAELREGISRSFKIAEAGFKKDLTAMNEAISDCLTLVGGVQSKYTWTSQESLKWALEKYDRVYHGLERPGLPFGIPPLDEKYPQGMKPGDVVIIGARPSMGKTAVMLNMALKQKVPVGILSLEMSQEQLTYRALSLLSGVPIAQWERAQVPDEALQRGVKRFGEREIHINDRGGLSIGEVSRIATQMKHRHGVQILMIDYLQLIKAKADSREQEIAEVSRQTKALAKNLQVPIVMLAQLNRKIEDRANKVPMMADLRESGQIEQDADFIIFPNRPHFWDEHEPKDLINFHVEKCRNGPTGTVVYGWDDELMMLKSRVKNYG